jgi:outer membrane receptor protein involved in Fe transport
MKLFCHSPLARSLLAKLFALSLLCCASLLAQTAPTPTTASAKSVPATTEETLILTPFEVSAGSEEGYHATQTLNGTRLKTDLRDIGSALTIFTEQMMNDLGANSINDILNFAAVPRVLSARISFPAVSSPIATTPKPSPSPAAPTPFSSASAIPPGPSSPPPNAPK